MAPPTSWNILQLDVSTHCTLRCPTCPRAALAPFWRNEHVSPAVVERLLPYAGRFRLVHLQGWGEPLSHPELPAIVRSFAGTGAACGLTTNGTLLTPGLGRALLDAGLGAVTVSLSGAKPSTQALLRPGSRLEDILEAAGRFKAMAGKACEVRLSFLRQPENQDEMAEAVRLAKRLKLDGVLGVNPTYHVVADHSMRLVPPGRTAVKASRRARWAAFINRQQLFLENVEPDRLPCCPNRPQENLAVAVDGGVSPCIFLQLPLRSRPPGFGKPLLSFGNVLKDALDALWDSAAYKGFRQPFIARESAASRIVVEMLEGMEQEGSALKSFKAALESMEQEHPLPAECSGCLKAEGL